MFWKRKKELPRLDEVSYVSGRVATREDVNSGAAAFVLQDESGASVSTASDMTIPQYAVHTDESGKRTAGIVVQAEYTEQLDAIVIGLLTADGKHFVGMEPEFTFCGTEPPN